MLVVFAGRHASFRVNTEVLAAAATGSLAITRTPLPVVAVLNSAAAAVLAVAVPVRAARVLSSWHVREHGQGRRPVLRGTFSDVDALPAAFALPAQTKGHRHATAAL